MTGNRSYFTDYEEIDGGFVAFGGNSKGRKITRKGKIKTGKLDFEDVYFVKELKFNLFSVSQMCDKKNSVLFTDTECVVLSPDFKLTDESHVLLKVPRKDNIYSVDLKNVIPQGGLTCLFAKSTPDESNLWHRRLGHVNFKTMNKLSLMKKMYCLVVTDDFCRFSWVFFLASKDETWEILKTFITGIENLIDLRVKVIRCDNRTEFKNRVMNQFCEMKGIKREFSVARTPQQNRVAEKKNRTLIEAARTIKSALSFMRPFGCPVTILNTIDHLCKFDGKADEGFFVGYSTNSKAFRVFNSRTGIVEENLHVQFIVAGNQSNGNAGTKACDDAGKARIETVLGKDYILLPMWPVDPLFSWNSKDSPDAGFNPSGEEEKMDTKDTGNESEASGKDSEVPSIEDPREDQRVNKELDASINITNNINVTPSNLSTQRNVENLRALLYGSIAQDMRTTTKHVILKKKIH
ncbi:ribonuclease H-like domain-containing protein [Tanacetum coccineum]